MKIISELTGKEYNTPEECLKAEELYKKEQKKRADEESKKLSEISKQKKELANAIEDADKDLSEANKLYEVAKNKAAEILEKSNKEVRDILDSAKKLVKAAEEKKLNAVLKFNKEFGPYTTKYTGEKAAEEFNRSLKRFDNIFDDFFKFWPFIR